MEQLQEEYREALEHAGTEKGYDWFLDAKNRLQWNSFDYVPEAHFSKGFEQALSKELEEESRPDGGHIGDDEVYLWYDPGLNAIVQEEIEPGLYAGIFDQEGEANHFMKERRQNQSLDPGRLELYRVEWEKIGTINNILKGE